MRRVTIWMAAMLLTAGGSACEGDDGGPGKSVQVGGTGGSMRDAGEAPEDSGMSNGDEDAGQAPPDVACDNVPVVQGGGTETMGLNSTVTPDDFRVSRVSAGYECDPGKLVIDLSNGRCPGGGSHGLRIEFDAEALRDGGFGTGANVIDGDAAERVTIRYRRPADPAGVWGNCGTGDFGALNLAIAPTAEAGDVEGEYSLTLADCDGVRSDQTVAGYMLVTVPQSLSEACP